MNFLIAAQRRSWLHSSVFSTAILYCSLLITGCEFPGQPKLSDRPIRSDEIVDFDVLFSQNCAGCHGANGEMGPAPPVNDPLFLAIIPDNEILRVIRKGRDGTPMPASAQAEGGTLTDQQIEVIAKGLKTRWKSGPAASLPDYVSALPKATDAALAIERGTAAFARACAECHGKNGEGGEGGGAINSTDFLGLISDQALRRVIITGRADLGMPAFNDNSGRAENYQPLTSAEIDDLVTLLAAWRTGSATVVATRSSSSTP